MLASRGLVFPRDSITLACCLCAFVLVIGHQQKEGGVHTPTPPKTKTKNKTKTKTKAQKRTASSLSCALSGCSPSKTALHVRASSRSTAASPSGV